MTVSSTTSRNEYNGNGSTDVFSYTFRILAQDHIAVYVDDVLQTITADYTVDGVGASGGGDVTFTTPPASGTANVVFLRAVPLTQETDYVENDPFPAESHEDALDKLTMIVQQQQEQLGRSLTFGATSTTTGVVLPEPSAEELIGWNAAGDNLENKTVVALGALVLPVSIADGGTGASTASGARTSLGLVIGTDVQAYDADTAKTDVAQTFTAVQKSTVTTDNDLTIDCATAMDVVCTPTAGGALTFTNIAAGQKFEILFINGSDYAITLGANIKVQSTLLATISATGRYILAARCLDGTNIDLTCSGALA